MPTLLVMTGLPASGKSYVAAALSARTGWPRHSSDRIRKQLYGIPPERFVSDTERGQLYATGVSERVYHEMMARGLATLRDGRSAIVDANFNLVKSRREADAIAAEAGARALFLALRAPRWLTERRLRAREGRVVESDARLEHYLRLEPGYEALSGEELGRTVFIDTSVRPLRENVQAILERVGE